MQTLVAANADIRALDSVALSPFLLRSQRLHAQTGRSLLHEAATSDNTAAAVECIKQLLAYGGFDALRQDNVRTALALPKLQECFST